MELFKMGQIGQIFSKIYSLISLNFAKKGLKVVKFCFYINHILVLQLSYEIDEFIKQKNNVSKYLLRQIQQKLPLWGTSICVNGIR